MNKSRARARALSLSVFLCLLAAFAAACGTDDAPGRVALQNDFDNPALPTQPPWTICESFYGGVEFGKIAIGTTSEQREVSAGLDYVLMVAAWDDPSCAAAHALPLASKNEEEVVPGQERILVLGLGNHQGPCPPQGVAPMPEALYERVRARWPAYGFQPYADRAQNAQCQP